MTKQVFSVTIVLHFSSAIGQGDTDIVNTMTVSEAKENLEQVIEQVISNVEPAIICTDTGQRTVLLPLAEFNSWQETFYLLSNPANAEHLRQSMLEAKTGQAVERSLIES